MRFELELRQAPKLKQCMCCTLCGMEVYSEEHDANLTTAAMVGTTDPIQMIDRAVCPKCKQSFPFGKRDAVAERYRLQLIKARSHKVKIPRREP